MRAARSVARTEVDRHQAWSNQNAVTNVRRLYNVLADTAEDGGRQLSHYQSGVGPESAGLLGWLLGGVAGVGLSRNVMDAYHWLTTTYEPRG